MKRVKRVQNGLVVWFDRTGCWSLCLCCIHKHKMDSGRHVSHKRSWRQAKSVKSVLIRYTHSLLFVMMRTESDFRWADVGLISGQVVCGSKYIVRRESARDHLDLLLSSRFWPPVYVADCAQKVALCTDVLYPELASQMWGNNQGCFSDPTTTPQVRDFIVKNDIYEWFIYIWLLLSS